MTLYKLTDSNGTTRAKPGEAQRTQWGEGVTHTTAGASAGKGLCSDAWLHAYTHPLLAALLHPQHVIFGAGMKLWEAEGDIEIRDGEMKVGTSKLTTLREISLPTPTTEQVVRFAIGCALSQPQSLHWVTWATQWLAGADRSRDAAAAAACAAYAADAASAAATSPRLSAIAEWAVSTAVQFPSHLTHRSE